MSVAGEVGSTRCAAGYTARLLQVLLSHSVNILLAPGVLWSKHWGKIVRFNPNLFCSLDLNVFLCVCVVLCFFFFPE